LITRFAGINAIAFSQIVPNCRIEVDHPIVRNVSCSPPHGVHRQREYTRACGAVCKSSPTFWGSTAFKAPDACFPDRGSLHTGLIKNGPRIAS
jgi:hypothetical protein